MSKKDITKKRRLGKFLKQKRRIPVLATIRTKRRLESNKFARDWRHTKIRSKVDLDGK
ncbi:50S ribosomal protein L39e [Candidatus Mancarchaeum acidiphilum]|uniref:Large ribosomal subunit protein eL39 n=1 Tax=Candidatus Mancarchaeum acidiphilum TaxID=1920749 RepID=A0A218NP48_9ARCH|nr:50S ribosomal protein L39e [Candidatus Mancarchaeum acidiphilum]ASI14206.1 50S ribosomal protein L39e [Candidatus Mancarchaeum acidiphilum]